ncbi:hypothetical protein [Streptomyces sp. NPDC127033]|uniref:hypothetical protein n=1 Tax=Streptomyces sp. NPDC127033 TaxID=3347110 RepID=UPI00364FC903
MWKWWLTAVGMNLILGVPAVVATWLLWYFLANGPLAEYGGEMRNPTENDGTGVLLVLLAPVVGFALLWWLANRPVRRRIPVGWPLYWPVSLLATLVPTLGLVISSAS